jgi:restriction system protein
LSPPTEIPLRYITWSGVSRHNVISMKGFQSGAVAASGLTNLRLVTWQEFQDLIEDSWLEEHFTKQIDEKLDGLMTYAEPFLPSWFERMTEEDKATYLAPNLKDKHDLFGVVMQSLGPYSRVLRKETIPSLPLRCGSGIRC